MPGKRAGNEGRHAWLFDSRRFFCHNGRVMTLDERKRKILGAVVRDYVETVRPVGSEDLAQRHAWGVKGATIRNELAELSELGYLRQPHTSAGRIPSDRGYRFYVDHLMVTAPVLASGGEDENRAVSGLELDYLLRRTCALLTRQTSYTSVATPPRPSDTIVSRVFVSAAGAGRLLLAALLSTGQVENRLLADMQTTSAGQAERLGNALNAAFAGQALDAATSAKAPDAPPALAPSLRAQFETMAEAVRQMLYQAADENSAYLEGESEILRQPEFRDGAKMDGLLGALQQRTLLFQTLSRALLGPNVAVVIGAENKVAAMHECSVVSAPYFVGARERGTIGVVGPTRMNYDRAVPAVEFFARSLTRTLTCLGHS